MHPAALSTERLLEECEARNTRRSGPGGQRRNKVETAVVLVHRPTGLVAEASERRSRGENLKAAAFRLRLQLALEVRGDAGEADQPSPLWTSRCRGGKVFVNPQHEDFPALLAEALDVVAAHDCDLPAAAARLQCTASQVRKFLELEPRAIAAVNQVRAERGQHRLK